MTPAKTVREQVEACFEPAKSDSHGRHQVDDLISIAFEHRALFAASEETKAENERLREAIELAHAELTDMSGGDFCIEAAVTATKILRAALNPGGSE